MKKLFKVTVVLLVLLMFMSVVASAAEAYTTYTYSYTGEVLESPDAYVPDEVIDSEYVDNDDFVLKTPADLEVDDADHVYIVDSGANAVYVLDSTYHYKFKIQTFINSHGVEDSFSGPSGIFISDEYIYVCDTNNNRIVMFDRTKSFNTNSAVYVKTVGQPESALIEEDSIYKPVALAVDEYGRMFIVSSTTYQGIIVMNDNGDFYGFIGAQATAEQSSSFWSKFTTSSDLDEENVSTEYNNITIDEDNFIYVTISTISDDLVTSSIVGKSSDGTYAPVKKLNASGKDVMRRNGFYPPSGEVLVSNSTTTTSGTTISGPSTLVDVSIGPLDTWSIIDQKRSKVFTYDYQGDLLFAFGDFGTQKGSITTLSAIAYKGDDMLLLDSGSLSFTVYRRTEYGDILLSALSNQSDRDYDTAVADWQEILKRNNNFDLAYIGIGESEYKSGNYDSAMSYFKAAYDTSDYSDAFKEQRKEWLSKYFLIVPVVLVVIIVLLAKFNGWVSKYNKKVSLKVGQKNIGEELAYSFHVIIHPFDGFWDLKREFRGSVRSAFLILIVVIITFFYKSVGTGYIFTGNIASYDSIFSTLISVIVPVFLWIIANWCFTTLFEGEGSLKDIFVATCYSLVPIPLLFIPSILLSNVLVSDEADFVTMLQGLAFVWTGILLFFGMMVTHDYSILKNLLSTIVTIIGMAFIMFITILFSTLIMKLISFISSIVVEINYRV